MYQFVTIMGDVELFSGMVTTSFTYNKATLMHIDVIIC